MSNIKKGDPVFVSPLPMTGWKPEQFNVAIVVEPDISKNLSGVSVFAVEFENGQRAVYLESELTKLEGLGVLTWTRHRIARQQKIAEHDEKLQIGIATPDWALDSGAFAEKRRNGKRQ